MPTIAFSLPDLFLIATIIECALTFCLIVIARAMPAPSRFCRNVLGALFIAIALDALSMLLIWHGGIRDALRDYSAFSIVIATFAMAAKGPLLYLFMRTLTQADYTLKARHLWHLAPLVSALFIVALYQLDTIKITLPIEANVTNWGTFYWWTVLRLAPTLYAIFAILSLRAMQALYDSHYAGDEYSYSYWIKLLAFGFFIQWGMALTTHMAGQYFPSGMTDIMGKVNDFLGLILVNGLLIYAFTLMRTLTPMLGNDEPLGAQALRPVPVTKVDAKEATAQVRETPSNLHSLESHSLIDTTETRSSYQPRVSASDITAGEKAALERIANCIKEQKLHLNPTLNLDKFANALGLGSKEVSRLINSYYRYSFSEFINAYRTLEAERLLRDSQHRDTPVSDIIRLSGFNSKSAFHRFFKRFTELSPSEYRAKLEQNTREKTPS